MTSNSPTNLGIEPTLKRSRQENILFLVWLVLSFLPLPIFILLLRTPEVLSTDLLEIRFVLELIGLGSRLVFIDNPSISVESKNVVILYYCIVIISEILSAICLVVICVRGRSRVPTRTEILKTFLYIPIGLIAIFVILWYIHPSNISQIEEDYIKLLPLRDNPFLVEILLFFSCIFVALSSLGILTFAVVVAINRTIKNWSTSDS